MVVTDGMMNLVKQCLSIAPSATAKDREIEMWIGAAIRDLERQGISASNEYNNDLVDSAVAMYVKANFGNTDIKEKELAMQSYNHLTNNLGLSSDYINEVEE